MFDSAGVLILGGYRCAVTYPRYREGRLFFYPDEGVAVLFDDDRSVETFSATFVRRYIVMLYDPPRVTA